MATICAWRRCLVSVAVFTLCALAGANSFAVAAEDSTHGALAREILAGSGVKGGLVVHVGCNGGRLTTALHGGDHYVVQGLDADAADVERARAYITSRGVYGAVSVQQWTGRRLPYADNLVNLIVAEEPDRVPMDEMMRVLAPKGVAYLKQDGQWTKKVKPWPDDIDQWTHFLHGADNNAVAHDSRVGPPRSMRWVGNPLWLRSHETESGFQALVSGGGRVFYILDEGPIGIVDNRLPCRWSLVARDAFNGVRLWKRPLPHWGWRAFNRGIEGKDLTQVRARRLRFPQQLQRRMVVRGDRVYATLGYTAPVSVMDAATGKVIRTLEGTQGTDEMLCSEGTLVLCVRHADAEARERRGETVGERLMAVDPDSGDILWEKAVSHISPLCLAVSDGRIVTLGSDGMTCRDLGSGEKLWRSEKAGKNGILVVRRGVVLLSERRRLSAFSAETGKTLWSKDAPREGMGARDDLFVADGLVWRGLAQEGLDLWTGEVKRTVDDTNLRSVGHHHRCYRGKATDRYLISAKEGVELLDVQQGKHSRNNWVRGACKLGIMPCNGLLYVPPDQCFCEPGVKLRGFAALAAEQGGGAGGPGLVKGPAYGQVSTAKISPASDDWPTLRHDSERSGSVSGDVSAKLSSKWHVDLNGRLTQPVIADGTLLVAEVDEHTVHALDAETGRELWRYTVGGRVDSPPTVYAGKVLFGSADGWVYCLRASDGKLAWRFRAAPLQRYVMAFGQLESAWPVHGSVLLQNGLVYFAAGRSSFLDGGIYLYAVDPATGEKVHEARLDGPHPDFSEGPGHCFYLRGARTEVLVGDGERVYLRQIQFTNELEKLESPFLTELGDMEVGRHLMATASFLDGSWYNRTYWMYSARWPGFYIANQAPKAGQLLVFDDSTTYGLKVFYRRNVHSPMFFPGNGYILFADRNDTEPALREADDPREPLEWLPQSDYSRASGNRWIRLDNRAVNYDKGIGYTRTEPPKWKTTIPVRVRAMVAAGGKLLAAGPPDVFDREEPFAALEGKKGARLWIVSATDGEKLAEYELNSPPVFDGMAVARGRVYISTMDGRVICMDKR